MENFRKLSVYFLLLCFTSMSSTLDIITPSQPLRDGHNESLVSEGGIFEAGFFNPQNSKSRYVGIWYKNIAQRTVVWVANREKPLHDASGVLQVDSDKGILRILDSKGFEAWSSNASKKAENPVVQLLDSGNLVLREEKNLSSILWQSFDYPGDTFLPGMKIRSNIRTGQHVGITSWKSWQDPTPGDFSMHIDTKGLPQLVITNGNKRIYRAGPWNGLGFTGTPELRDIKFMKLLFELNEDEVFYEYKILNNSTLMRSRLLPEGYPLRLTWSSQKNGWEVIMPSPSDQCEGYSFCGPNTNCNGNDPRSCKCLTGFTTNSSGGCSRAIRLECRKGDSFQKYQRMKLPDTSSSWYNKTMSLGECEKLCLRSCNCTAYSSLNISDQGSGCLHWFDSIVDLRELREGGQDFYIRVSVSDQVKNGMDKRKLAGIVIGCSILMMSTLVLVGLTIWIKKRLLHPGKAIYREDKSDKEDIDLPIYEFSTISNATNQFSERNKLGQGGFGPVYKGILHDGQEIAVKRLSKTSGQGTNEFKNEVLLIAKLQHRNLVKLLGCSIQQEEKLLIYEFMLNGSLDYFIFNSKKTKLLDWTKRFHIIDGIARGLLYLHHDSRLRIIHRDLKTSNILLDNNMNPKISDFGLARIFGGDQTEANTNRVMGTYGYMPPEYAMHGSFSDKSDVFSFGVIVLEIISGRKNRGFCDPHHHLNLLGHAWKIWIEKRPMDLMDEQLQDSVVSSELLRCIQVGLLCVQQRPEDRPNMSTVVLMLNGEKLLPNPSEPGFYIGRDNQTLADSTIRSSEECSINEASNSTLEPR
ncbi:G-type lectin S-receptor-like serine/threonine-protein kinase At4g27290 isoform X2 [Prosopis cineraria]|uniref:G-type lectin S-receptor-like serine/threonine-protein kinase At4g27290 isoform X2 n=1 Tax=Prosopis cineraria TaxID=364024 RepID=UPI00240EE7B1|nr:G-type lectin S-receptor-like serine/threonine-protein kinase At4g27290 isoform X2 [Prosopis cineraria]